jgi:hypothetical protein
MQYRTTNAPLNFPANCEHPREPRRTAGYSRPTGLYGALLRMVLLTFLGRESGYTLP